MKYPNYKIYEKVYKRFFEKGVNYLIDLADLKPTDAVLDLCGGNARLTKELKKISQNVSYLDEEKDMIPPYLEKKGIKVYNTSIQNYVENFNLKYDKVFCEQAVNYWLLHIDIEKFANIFNKDALFIFNTFINKPSEKPTIKQYTIDNVEYLEISYLANNQVQHIQVREGYEPHFTFFDYISKEQYYKLLSPYFDIEVFENGKSAVYRCKRK